ncbi:MAG: replication factor C large subunit [Halodesulfurarchaeum sp.]|nr:replication factor C large subunit [Halodesulfurarchaeum sp.]
MADWTERYRPETLAEVRGNDAARDDFEEWAETWPEHREAVILHGSPGVGKTSAAHALAADRGWDVIELNASDQRTGDIVEQVAGEAARSGTLSAGSGGRKLVILDEADNLHGTVDRGGTKAITSLVKAATQPVVLIANEFYEMSRGLRNACRDIEFRDVSKRSILPVLRDICRREGVEYADAALEAIAEKNDGDLRSAINDLQALAETTSVLEVEDVVTGNRDRTEGIFPFLDAVLKEEDAEGALKTSYDVDETPDDLINWVEDNVPKDYAGAELARAYDALATGDRWLGRVRSSQNYSYWRYVTDNVTAGVAAAREGTKGGWTRYGPPSYWSKLGRSRGTRETRDYVARKIAEVGGMSMGTARRVVLPYLAAMTHHCKNRELTVAMTAAYDLEATHVAFVTGSGEDTNKVQSIVEDATEQVERAAVEHSGGAFAGSHGSRTEAVDVEDTAAPAGEGDKGESDGAETAAGEGDDSRTEEEEDEAQSGLGDFV